MSLVPLGEGERLGTQNSVEFPFGRHVRQDT